MLSLPFIALRRRRKKAARAKLTDGLAALDQGQWSRAEKLLDTAAREPGAEDDGIVTIARIGAARAAASRGDGVAANAQLDALATLHPVSRALAAAELAMARDRPDEALVALDGANVQPPPPRRR